METLIDMLERIETDLTIRAKYGFVTEYGSKFVADASLLASKLLITDEGKCNWLNIEWLKCTGYDVFPVEKNNKGWLMGGIQTRKGILVYD